MDMNNEMDELFRKAGEDYPLNLGKPDWDAVAGKLHTDTGDLGPGFGLAAAAPRKRRRFLWLLLLLPVGIYGLLESGSRKAAGGDLTAASRGLQAAKTADGGDSQAAGGRRQAGKTAGGLQTGNDKSTTVSDSKHAGTFSPVSSRGSLSDAGNEKRSPVTGKTGTSGSGTTAGKTATNKSGDSGPKTNTGLTDDGGKVNVVTTDNYQKGNTETTVNGSDKDPGNSVTANSTATEGKATDSSATTGSAEKGTEDNGSPLAEIVMTNQANSSVADSDRKATTAVAEKLADKKDSLKDKKSVIHPSVKQQRGFYAGVTAAPDFSTVKFQAMKSTGYSFGIVAGYRIDRHFSLETGLSWDRKKYYSKGEYFDKSRTKIPSTVDVTYIDGYCDMFEIPLTLRYDLTSGKRGHWFAAAGFSSYLMKNENYLYGAETNNVAWSKYVDYKNSGNNFFSIIQFSAGYELNWSARNRIRIEPYFKAPVSGVGIGSLPISSVGMTFGFIHSFR